MFSLIILSITYFHRLYHNQYPGPSCLWVSPETLSPELHSDTADIKTDDDGHALNWTVLFRQTEWEERTHNYNSLILIPKSDTYKS